MTDRVGTIRPDRRMDRQRIDRHDYPDEDAESSSVSRYQPRISYIVDGVKYRRLIRHSHIGLVLSATYGVLCAKNLLTHSPTQSELVVVVVVVVVVVIEDLYSALYGMNPLLETLRYGP